MINCIITRLKPKLWPNINSVFFGERKFNLMAALVKLKRAEKVWNIAWIVCNNSNGHLSMELHWFYMIANCYLFHFCTGIHVFIFKTKTLILIRCPKSNNTWRVPYVPYVRVHLQFTICKLAGKKWRVKMGTSHFWLNVCRIGSIFKTFLVLLFYLSTEAFPENILLKKDVSLGNIYHFRKLRIVILGPAVY